MISKWFLRERFNKDVSEGSDKGNDVCFNNLLLR